jgi:hypothetical protein
MRIYEIYYIQLEGTRSAGKLGHSVWSRGKAGDSSKRTFEKHLKELPKPFLLFIEYEAYFCRRFVQVFPWEVEPLLLQMGKKAVYMGGYGADSTANLAVNIMLATHVIALSESLAMVRKAGLDAAKFLDVVARSNVAEMKGPKMLEHDYSPQFYDGAHAQGSRSCRKA